LKLGATVEKPFAGSRAPRGARGLKQSFLLVCFSNGGRAPRGARGLKRVWAGRALVLYASRPARGAWIETEAEDDVFATLLSRAPRGARGLKLASDTQTSTSPQSRPARGAWIETFSA